MISPNILISIGISIVYWIGSIMLVALNKNVFGFLAPFEASNNMYASIEKLLSSNISALPMVGVLTIIAFFIIIIVINTIILFLARKRWLRLGV